MGLLCSYLRKYLTNALVSQSLPQVKLVYCGKQLVQLLTQECQVFYFVIFKYFLKDTSTPPTLQTENIELFLQCNKNIISTYLTQPGWSNRICEHLFWCLTHWNAQQQLVALYLPLQLWLFSWVPSSVFFYLSSEINLLPTFPTTFKLSNFTLLWVRKAGK